jgi:hypothetical protein
VEIRKSLANSGTWPVRASQEASAKLSQPSDSQSVKKRKNRGQIKVSPAPVDNFFPDFLTFMSDITGDYLSLFL